MKEKLTMLVIESAGSKRALQSEIFQSEYHVMEAEKGLSAMKMLHKSKMDVVIPDTCVSDMDGGTVLQQIKAVDVLKNIPVIVKTTKEEKSGAWIQRLGAEDVITIDCDPVIFNIRVHNIVRRYKIGTRNYAE